MGAKTMARRALARAGALVVAAALVGGGGSGGGAHAVEVTDTATCWKLGPSRCRRAKRAGGPCEFYRERSGVAMKRFGCGPIGLCEYSTSQSGKCKVAPECDWISASSTPGISKRYGCVTKDFCGFETEEDCKLFGNRCEWTGGACSAQGDGDGDGDNDGGETQGETNLDLSDKGRKPNLFFLLVDDLGSGDAGFGIDPKNRAKAVTSEMTRLAQDGLILDRHYAHWHCSPSRRSALTGRNPLHTGEDLSSEFDDHIDVRWTTIGEKLKPAGYTNLFIGKGHLGFRSRQHLPINRGFDLHLGMLGGYNEYRTRDRWLNDKIYRDDDSYSTLLFGRTLEEYIRKHFTGPGSDEAGPIFAFLPFQAPHSPIRCPSMNIKEERDRYGNFGGTCMERMTHALDTEVGILAKTLEEVGQWDNSLIVFASDNGGSRRHWRQDGNNYPYRAEKSTSFEGGVRVASFLAGGFVPPKLRGKRSQMVTHVADWFTTFCFLAGVDHADDPPLAPRVPGLSPEDVEDLYRPGVRLAKDATPSNLWGEDSYPGVDGVNVWPYLKGEFELGLASDAAHAFLPVSGEIMVAGRYKLVTAQPCELSITGEGECITRIEYRWAEKNDEFTWAPERDVPVEKRATRCLQVVDHRDARHTTLQPCLFDLEADPRETTHVDSKPELLATLWRKLNETLLYQYNTRIPGKEHGISPGGVCSGWEYDRSLINGAYEPVCP